MDDLSRDQVVSVIKRALSQSAAQLGDDVGKRQMVDISVIYDRGGRLKLIDLTDDAYAVMRSYKLPHEMLLGLALKISEEGDPLRIAAAQPPGMVGVLALMTTFYRPGGSRGLMGYSGMLVGVAVYNGGRAGCIFDSRLGIVDELDERLFAEMDFAPLWNIFDALVNITSLAAQEHPDRVYPLAKVSAIPREVPLPGKARLSQNLLPRRPFKLDGAHGD